MRRKSKLIVLNTIIQNFNADSWEFFSSLADYFSKHSRYVYTRMDTINLHVVRQIILISINSPKRYTDKFHLNEIVFSYFRSWSKRPGNLHTLFVLVRHGGVHFSFYSCFQWPLHCQARTHRPYGRI